jgi:5-methylcytosine-specific restriction enzyme subunit McrC
MKPFASRVEPLSALEHDEIPIRGLRADGVLTREEADALVQINERRPSFCVRRFNSVKLAQYCGVVTVGHRTLEILPKLRRAPGQHATARTTLVRMLRDAAALNVHIDENAAHRTAQLHLLDIFVELFLRSVAEVVSGGLQRNYVDTQCDLPVVRGRINVARQLARLANRPDLVACDYDDLTEDNSWNRLLKSGLLGAASRIQDPSVATRCSELLAAFVDVTPIDSVDLRQAFPADRRFQRYAAAARWARLLLSSLAPELSAGDSELPGLLFDMNKLFEGAVASALKRTSSGGIRFRFQTQRYLGEQTADRASVFKTKPDIVMLHEASAVVVADTKWKLLEYVDGRAEPDEADVYQVLGYAGVFETNRVALIYPWHEGIPQEYRGAYTLRHGHGRSVALNLYFVDIDSGDYRLADGTSLREALVS